MLQKAKIWGVTAVAGVTGSATPGVPPSVQGPPEPISGSPGSSSKPPEVESAEEVIQEGRKAIEDYVAKGAKGSQRGVASVGSMVFALVVVGSAVYVISNADDKVKEAEKILGELAIGELMYRAAGGGIVGLVASSVFDMYSDNRKSTKRIGNMKSL